MSDYTESAGKHSAEEAHKCNQIAMPEMTLEEVTAIIFKAYAHNTEIRIQERQK